MMMMMIIMTMMMITQMMTMMTDLMMMMTLMTCIAVRCECTQRHRRRLKINLKSPRSALKCIALK